MDKGSERVVVITGASAGVGRAAALAFAARGARLGLLARGRERLDAAVREVEQAGGRAIAIPTDVADAAAVEAAAQQVEAELGPIDVWVNNAMATIFAPFWEISPEEYRRATEVTYLGFVHGTMSALRRMRPRDRGVIVQVGSALAYRGIPLQSPYCGAKHAIQGMVDSVRTELIHERSRIHIAEVHLPAMNTPQFDWALSRMPREAQPVPPIFQPEVAARAIEWASRHRRRQVSVGWPTVKAIWGNKLLAPLADIYLGRTGFEAQQTDQPADAERPANLFAPVAGGFGAHGRFDDRSKPRSVQWELNARLPALAVAALVVAGLAVWGARRG